MTPAAAASQVRLLLAAVAARLHGSGSEQGGQLSRGRRAAGTGARWKHIHIQQLTHAIMQAPSTAGTATHMPPQGLHRTYPAAHPPPSTSLVKDCMVSGARPPLRCSSTCGSCRRWAGWGC